MTSSILYEQVDPVRLGARPCKRCGEVADLLLDLRELGPRVLCATLQCNKCFREAGTEAFSTPLPAIRQVIERWNSSWPDISHFLDGDSEGIRYGR